MTPNRPLNLVANYLATGWTVVLQLALTPIYVRLLGVESYGLIGFYTIVQAVLQVLDAGVSPTLNRELARRTAFDKPVPGTGDLVRTLEVLYWLLGLVLGLAVAAGSSFLARDWVNSEQISPAIVQRAIALMGLSFALQWPIGFYVGGLLGLQRQGRAALVSIANVTVFGAGAVALLIPFRQVDVFFIWRSVTSLIILVLARSLFWAPLRGQIAGEPVRVRRSSLAGIWAFSLGMTAIAVTSMLLSQADKLVLTKILSLKNFGYYTLAASAASLLPQLVAPVFTAVFPMLSQAVMTGNREAEREQFHLSAQLTTLVACPAALLLVFHAHDILWLWTGQQVVAGAAAGPLALLALGALINSLMAIPYALQLAHGWTRVTVNINLVLLVVTVPYAVFATWRWGTVGAASTAVVVNGAAVLVGAWLTFRRLLAGAGLPWLKRDVALPLLSAAAVAAAGTLLPAGEARLLVLLKLALVGTATYLAALATAHQARARILSLIAKARGAPKPPPV